jgi:nucleotide-binding universal stress UspA family protein
MMADTHPTGSYVKIPVMCQTGCVSRCSEDKRLLMADPGASAYIQAIRDFRAARQRAALEVILQRLRGKQTDLLSYEDVRRKLHAATTARRELHEVPLASIVGSVGRYTDFTRSFLPREAGDEERWARVRAMTEGLSGLPPVELYQIGDAYFVRDGHHRVSVARQVGAESIEAYVTEVRSKVSLTPADDPPALVIKAELTDFLEATKLNEVRPEAEIVLTEPGRYPQLLDQIRAHHQALSSAQDGEADFETAVADWFDRVYLPIVEIIRGHGILRDFPDRTEADLYLWIHQHRELLAEHLGWDVWPEQAAVNLAAEHSRSLQTIAGRFGERLVEAITPDELESGPPAGDWRRQVVDRRPGLRLFQDILVPLAGSQRSWQALEQALLVAQREGGRVIGLHVRSEAEGRGRRMGQIEGRFLARCQQAEVEGRFTRGQGKVADLIFDRARWTDLVSLGLSHPPAEGRLARLGSGLRTLMRRLPRPILFVPGVATAMNRPLVAFDGSPKAWEALFVAAYTACAWELPLSVLVVDDGKIDPAVCLDQAKEYLEARQLAPAYELVAGEASQVILEVVEESGADLLLIGGYSAPPMVEAVLGSSVDTILRRARQPLIVCR